MKAWCEHYPDDGWSIAFLSASDGTGIYRVIVDPLGFPSTSWVPLVRIYRTMLEALERSEARP